MHGRARSSDGPTEIQVRSRGYALLLAGGYALLATLYIVVSSRLAASMSGSVEELRRIETMKGVLFVTVTALAAFFLAWAALRRLERAHSELRRREITILASDRRVFAGLLAATTAHDANNVLMGVIADIEDLPRVLSADPRVERLGTAIDRLITLNRRLMDTVRQGREGEATEVQLLREIRASIDSIRGHMLLRDCDLRVSGNDRLTLHTHPLLVHQIVTNLVINAAEATQSHGRIDVMLKEDRGYALIEVHDDGRGIPEARRPDLFTALQSTKPDGTGLGLFSVKSCAAALGGTAEVTASPLGGACFQVRLPLEMLAHAATSAPLPALPWAPADASRPGAITRPRESGDPA